MDEKDIRIVKVEPMHVASAYAFGNNPEESALAKMGSFVEKNNLLEEGHMPPTFGFNNPNPSAGSPNYGYEVLLPVAENTVPTDNVRIVNFSGGLYAVAPCRGLHNIGDEWLTLAKWREGTEYTAGKHQWLEHLLSPPGAPPNEMTFDLYLPIAE